LTFHRSVTSWYWKFRKDVLKELAAFIFRRVHQESLFTDCNEDEVTNLFSKDWIFLQKRRVNLRSWGNIALDFIVCVIFIQCFVIGVRCKFAHLRFFSIREPYLEVMKDFVATFVGSNPVVVITKSFLQCNGRHEIFYDK